jgi:type II secretory pathway pseudopilin PulG
MRPARGFAYLEVIVAIVLIAVALIPALDALKSGVQASSALAEGNSVALHLQEKMQIVLAEPLEALQRAVPTSSPATTPSAYSDVSGSAGRRLVYLAHFDGATNAVTASTSGLVWVKVAIEGSGHELQTLSSLE